MEYGEIDVMFVAGNKAIDDKILERIKSTPSRETIDDGEAD